MRGGELHQYPNTVRTCEGEIRAEGVEAPDPGPPPDGDPRGGRRPGGIRNVVGAGACLTFNPLTIDNKILGEISSWPPSIEPPPHEGEKKENEVLLHGSHFQCPLIRKT